MRVEFKQKYDLCKEWDIIKILREHQHSMFRRVSLKKRNQHHGQISHQMMPIYSRVADLFY